MKFSTFKYTAAVLTLLSLPIPAFAQAWTTPSACTSGVTGNEEDDPPIVEFYEGNSPSTLTLRDSVGAVTFNRGTGYAQVTIANSFDSFYLTVSYTTFLGGYVAPTVRNWNSQQIFTLPDPGYANSPQSKLYGSVTFTFRDNSSNLMRNASVMFVPDFPGGSPYTIQADNDGKVTINCFQTFPGGNSAFVVSEDGSVSYETNLTVGSNKLAESKKKGRKKNHPGPVAGTVTIVK
jgi:hypothetical protein